MFYVEEGKKKKDGKKCAFYIRNSLIDKRLASSHPFCQPAAATSTQEHPLPVYRIIHSVGCHFDHGASLCVAFGCRVQVARYQQSSLAVSFPRTS